MGSSAPADAKQISLNRDLRDQCARNYGYTLAGLVFFPYFFIANANARKQLAQAEPPFRSHYQLQAVITTVMKVATVALLVCGAAAIYLIPPDTRHNEVVSIAVFRAMTGLWAVIATWATVWTIRGIFFVGAEVSVVNPHAILVWPEEDKTQPASLKLRDREPVRT